MKSTIVIAALAGAAFGSASATPGAEEPLQEVVGYADLDLSQHEAAVTLYTRIRHAARNVCRVPGLVNYGRVVITNQCAADATARAVQDVNAATLTSYYVSRHGVSRLADASAAPVREHLAEIKVSSRD